MEDAINQAITRPSRDILFREGKKKEFGFNGDLSTVVTDSSVVSATVQYVSELFLSTTFKRLLYFDVYICVRLHCLAKGDWKLNISSHR